MKFLFDFFPIILFFITYRFFDIYVATATAMGASIVQVLYIRVKTMKFEMMSLISLALILVLGGATLLLHNPWFIKFKPTGLYWLACIVFLGSQYINSKTLIEKIMENNINLSKPIWKKLNLAWCVFFFVMGSLNLYVAYFFDTNTWVNFKLFGGAGLTFIFVLLQAIYLSKHHDDKSAEVRSEARR